MPRSLFVLALLASTLLGGCILNNLAPTQQLRDRIYLLNDETRWNRIDLASQQVVPSFRHRFIETRREWGHRVAVADTEVSALVIAPDSDSATSMVEISWYDQSTMTLHGTILRQHWAKTAAGFLLDEESVYAGDEELMFSPEDEEEEESASDTASRVGEPYRG